MLKLEFYQKLVRSLARSVRRRVKSFVGEAVGFTSDKTFLFYHRRNFVGGKCFTTYVDEQRFFKEYKNDVPIKKIILRLCLPFKNSFFRSFAFYIYFSTWSIVIRSQLVKKKNTDIWYQV